MEMETMIIYAGKRMNNEILLVSFKIAIVFPKMG